MVMQLIINNNGTPDDAKDIYQEAIIVLYNKIKKGDFELNSKLKTFIIFSLQETLAQEAEPDEPVRRRYARFPGIFAGGGRGGAAG